MFSILKPPPTSHPYHTSGSSQCTSPKLPVSSIEPGLVIHFLYDIIHVFFRMEWLNLPAVQGTLKSLLHSSKASIIWRSAFFTVQLSRPYMTTGKTIALTRRTFGTLYPLFFAAVFTKRRYSPLLWHWLRFILKDWVCYRRVSSRQGVVDHFFLFFFLTLII